MLELTEASKLPTVSHMNDGKYLHAQSSQPIELFHTSRRAP